MKPKPANGCRWGEREAEQDGTLIAGIVALGMGTQHRKEKCSPPRSKLVSPANGFLIASLILIFPGSGFRIPKFIALSQLSYNNSSWKNFTKNYLQEIKWSSTKILKEYPLFRYQQFFGQVLLTNTVLRRARAKNDVMIKCYL
jgi:hypothetical protein